MANKNPAPSSIHSYFSRTEWNICSFLSATQPTPGRVSKPTWMPLFIFFRWMSALKWTTWSLNDAGGHVALAESKYIRKHIHLLQNTLAILLFVLWDPRHFFVWKADVIGGGCPYVRICLHALNRRREMCNESCCLSGQPNQGISALRNKQRKPIALPQMLQLLL